MRALFALFALGLSFTRSQYCISGPTTTVDTTLYGTTLQGDTSSIVDPSSPCPGSLNVRDLTGVQLADLTIGQTYQISYNVSSCGSVFSVRSQAWIDYNGNGKYDTAEALYPLSSTYGVQTHSFTVPDTSLLGNTRIRVQVQEGNATSIDPCASFPYGATTDYSVSIKPAGPAYCETGPTTGNDMNLGPVQLTGFTMSINEESDCPSVIGGADLTDLVADVNPGSTYTLNYKITDCNEGTTAWPTLSGAWIDYNQDGVFSDWESLGVSQQPGKADVSLTFTVPIAVKDQEVLPGNTRMRVQVQETNAEYLDPCAHFAWGGTKDFAIRIWEYKNYCVSGPTATGTLALGTVTLNGQSQTINDPATCADAQTGPVDHTLMVADLVPAVPFTISWEVLVCGGGQPQTMSAAWLDYNQNEVLEAWEQITPRSSANGLVSYAFKVPPSTGGQVVVGGPTRLRVQLQSTSGSLDPCAQFQNGGTRDFTANIVVPTQEEETVSNETKTIVKTYGGSDRYSRVKRIPF